MIVFDMDGVLVDVTESYRQTIVETVRHFSGREISRDSIQDYKNQGGWNNDWALSQKILADLGVDVEYGVVVEEFQRLFFGENNDGLMQREVWIDRTNTLERLSETWSFSVFTGRLRDEAQMTLDRFAKHLTFRPVVGDDDVSRSKPDPEGLAKIRSGLAAKTPVYYLGDTLDDARAAAGAGVPFIGVGHGRDAGHAKTVELMREAGAVAIIESINELEGVLPR
jgi:HAD superfamily phosphatase